MTAEEIGKLQPRYILTEEEEAKIPTRAELHRRYLALPRDVLATLDEFQCPTQEALLGSVFRHDELTVFLKGEKRAFALLEELAKSSEGKSWDAIRDYVWRKCFRRDDLPGIYAYPPRHRMGHDLF